MLPAERDGYCLDRSEDILTKGKLEKADKNIERCGTECGDMEFPVVEKYNAL